MLYEQTASRPLTEAQANARKQAYDWGQHDGRSTKAALDDMVGSRQLMSMIDKSKPSDEDHSSLWLAYYHGRKAGRDESGH